MTSPPYNTLPTSGDAGGIHSGNTWIKNAAMGYEDNKEESHYQEWINEVVHECLRVSQGLVWINHKPRYREGEAIIPQRFITAPIYCEVIWDRGISMAMNCKRFAPSYEYIHAFGTPHHWNDHLSKMMAVWYIQPKRDEKIKHPCPYPIELPLRLIEASSKEGDIVIDPFLGSGTTSLAAKRLNRKSVGIEQDKEYAELAKNRIEQDQPLLQGAK